MLTREVTAKIKKRLRLWFSMKQRTIHKYFTCNDCILFFILLVLSSLETFYSYFFVAWLFQDIFNCPLQKKNNKKHVIAKVKRIYPESNTKVSFISQTFADFVNYFPLASMIFSYTWWKISLIFFETRNSYWFPTTQWQIFSVLSIIKIWIFFWIHKYSLMKKNY